MHGRSQRADRRRPVVVPACAWEGFLDDPGPVVVGTAQGGSCFGASYELLLNVAHRVGKAGLADRVPMTFIAAEPFLGHFGLGGAGGRRQ